MAKSYEKRSEVVYMDQRIVLVKKRKIIRRYNETKIKKELEEECVF
jgi:hypothetical protein